MLAILASGGVAAVAVLGRTSELHYLIPIVLIFIGAMFLLVCAAVFTTALKDPTRLMLGEVSGHEFLEYQRLTLGDSTAGDQMQTIIAPRTLQTPPELTPPDVTEETP